MNYADIVPQVSLPIVYRHSGDPRHMPKSVTASPYRFQPNPAVRAWQFVQGIIQLLGARSILGSDDHRIENYRKKLEAIAGV
jgi:hypothetical protein